MPRKTGRLSGALKPILLVVCVLIFWGTSSCSPSEKIYKHACNRDLVALIKDDVKYPEHRRMAQKYIANGFDYDSYSYSSLLELRDISEQDPKLSEFFTAIIADREFSVAKKVLSDPKTAAVYYKSHLNEQAFLRPVIRVAYVDNIESLTYEEARIVAQSFANTDLAQDITKSFKSYREKLYPASQIFNEEYQEAVFAKLANMNLSQLASYYKSHSQEQAFLIPAIKRAYLDETLTYPEAKLLYEAFDGTALAPFFEVKALNLHADCLESLKSSIDEYFDYEASLVEAYKAQAYEDAMLYLAEASGGILVEFMPPSVSDVATGLVAGVVNDPVSFAQSVVSGAIDDAKSTVKSVVNWLTGNNSKKTTGTAKGNADQIFNRAYAAHISEQEVVSIVGTYVDELSKQIAQSRCVFFETLTGKNYRGTEKFNVYGSSVKTHRGSVDISDLRYIVNNQNKEDNVGEALAFASYLPVVGEAAGVADFVYSVGSYQYEYEVAKSKIDAFQEKFNDFFSEKVNYYVSVMFGNCSQYYNRSRNKFEKSIYENF